MNKWHPILALSGIVLILLGFSMLPKGNGTGGSTVPGPTIVVDYQLIQGHAYKYPGIDTVYIFDGGTMHAVASPEAYARWYHKKYRGLPLDQYAPITPMPDGAWRVGQGGPIK